MPQKPKTPKLNHALLLALSAAAGATQSCIKLEVTSQGAALNLQKFESVLDSTSHSRTTTINCWVDRNDPQADTTIAKAFRALRGQ